MGKDKRRKQQSNATDINFSDSLRERLLDAAAMRAVSLQSEVIIRLEQSLIFDHVREQTSGLIQAAQELHAKKRKAKHGHQHQR
jgi:hypothetical protein